ncbi:methyl-accepting chemotaxis protein [Cardiobacteriaceae bacterium TAE3-ERU3]|nr:methyl-accepting chemotaxis protein [Cardiobacteriaceae bacterium TAE3-ERU3]
MLLSILTIILVVISLAVLVVFDHDSSLDFMGYDFYVLTVNYIAPLALVLSILTGFIGWRYLRKKIEEQAATASQIATLEIRARRDQDAILRLMDELAEFSNGDLTIEAQVTEDFTGAIADSVNYAIESMRDLVGTINSTSNQVSLASHKTKKLAEEMRGSSIEQKQMIVNMTTTIGEMVHSLDRVSLSTTDSAEIARESVKIARNGSEKVHNTIEGMNKIREHIQDTSKRIKRLGESSQEIGNIVEMIKGIADQTSILALNATIQASAAGEAGKGFAVVADEVQKLAERSTKATRRIESLVNTIQGDTGEAIHSMEKSTMEVVNGADIAEQAGDALNKIESVSTSLASLIDRISQSTQQVSDRAKKIASEMKNVNIIAEENMQNVSKTSDAINNLSELASDLEGSVSHFTLPKSED